MGRPVIVRSVRRGRSPNCSATGSVVGIALVSAAAAGVVLNAFADRFLRWTRRPPGPDPDVRVRPEGDGAIVAWPDPPALLEVDADGARAAIEAGATVVGGRPAPEGALSAPTEVHLAVTDRCPARCSGCYLSAEPGRGGVDPELRDDLARLADLGVLEIALGGGEALLRDDLIALAHHVRALGMVPNLTTSGFGLTAAKARELAVFGQVNVSIDGLGAHYAAVRGWDGTELGLRALALLRDAGVRAGVNTVLTRVNVDGLPALGERIAALGAVEWQWLRFKPTGRGADRYAELALTPSQARSLWPLALAAERDTGLAVRFDCALVPFLADHGPPVEALGSLGVAGCPGGHSLWARGASGRWSACSFVDGSETADWDADPGLVAWRRRAADPPEPCRSCAYRSVCRGGCRVVAAHLTGDPLAADPECPRVREVA